MAAVTGIGGFFFRARDPEALNRWYAEHFGVVMADSKDYDDPGWFQDRGETVFSAFGEDSDSFGAPGKSWKINFRVSDLDGMVDRLRDGPNGRPTRSYPNALRGAEDPGNRISLGTDEESVARVPARRVSVGVTAHLAKTTLASSVPPAPYRAPAPPRVVEPCATR